MKKKLLVVLVLALGFVGLGCSSGSDEALSGNIVNEALLCDDGNKCTHDTVVNGECRHRTKDYVSMPDYCTDHPETCENATNYRWRPEVEVKLNCAWLSQKPDAGAHTKTCGRTSLVMAAACIDGYTPEYSEVLGLVEWMKKNIPSYYPNGWESGTYVYQLEEAAKGYYGLSAQSFGYYRRDEVTLKDMYKDLEQGIPILVSVWMQDDCNLTDVMKKFPYSGHDLLLVGITPTHVILNDPWAFDIALGRNRQYTIGSFLTAWKGGVRFNQKRP